MNIQIQSQFLQLRKKIKDTSTTKQGWSRHLVLEHWQALAQHLNLNHEQEMPQVEPVLKQTKATFEGN